jgi:hypothetical protein
MADPVQYYLYRDYAKFGLSANEANLLLTKKISNRLGYSSLAIIHHIQDGRTTGSLRHWVGVSASSTCMVQRDGSILWIIPESDGPWTNGDVCNPEAEVQYLLTASGGDPNRCSLTIEAEGTPWDSLTAAQLDTIEWIDRMWMKKYPHITTKNIHRHRAINKCTRYNCPGAGDHNDYHIAVMKRLDGTPTTQYAMPIVYPWLKSDEGINRKIGSTVVYACERVWTVKNQTPRLKTAKMSTNTADMVGPQLVAGDTFPGKFVLYNKTGGWVLTEWGTRVFMGDLTEAVSFTQGGGQ